MKVVLETADLIAPLNTTDTPPVLVYRACRKKCFEVVTAAWLLGELRRVSRYPKLRRYLKPAEVSNLINGLRHQAMVLETSPAVELPPDPDDNPMPAMAEASGAHCLVTGNKADLMALGSIGGTPIVTARQLVDSLEI